MKVTRLKFQYFNRIQNLSIAAEGENIIPKFDRVITIEAGKHMHIGENEHGVVNFGLWLDDEKKRPGHGGFWSSREAVVGPLIGERLVHVAINGVAASMTYEALERLLPDEYHIVERGAGSGKHSETVYEIQRKDGHNEETPYHEIMMLVPAYRYG